MGSINHYLCNHCDDVELLVFHGIGMSIKFKKRIWSGL